MRYAPVVLFLCGSAVVHLAAADPPGAASPERVQGLIGQLGSAKFAHREQAARELEALGAAVVPALREMLAAPGTDGEVRRRVELLVRKLEDQQFRSSLLTARRVRLNLKNVTIMEALAELARQSGNAVTLTDHGELAGRKLTLDTGETTFWDALGRLCKEANMVEGSIQTYAPSYGRKGFKGGRAWQPKVVFAPGVPLIVGTPSSTPACHTGVVRVRALHAAAAPEGQIEIVLEVSGEPRLLGFCEAGAVAVLKAVDDRGQSLASVAPPPVEQEEPLGKFGLNKFGGLVVAYGNVLNGCAFGGSPASAAAPFETTIRLLPGKDRAKKLSELTGKLVVQTAVEAEPRIVVPNILQAAGQTVRDGLAGTLTVAAVKYSPDGTVRLVLTMENDAGQNGKAGNIVLVGAQRQTVVVNGGSTTVEGNPLPLPVAAAPRLRDAAGKEFALVELSLQSLTINNSQISQTLTVVYRPRAGQGPPAQLAVPGQRTLVFEVPFTLRDIVLP